MFGAMATHIFVPALPAAAQDLHASPGAMQLTITLYLLGHWALRDGMRGARVA